MDTSDKETNEEEQNKNCCPLEQACSDDWSWDVKSHEVKLCGPKQRIAHFHPNWSNGTAGVRGTRVLNGGRFYWEVIVSRRIFGTSMMFGIGTKNARLHVDAFVNMLGEDKESWGLSHKGYIWHNGTFQFYTKPFPENKPTTIGIYFDGIAGTLTYYKDNESLGVAYKDLNKITEPLYPMVCSTAAKTQMALGVMKRGHVSLQDICRATIVKNLKNESQVDQLELPLSLKRFISEELDDSNNIVDSSSNNSEAGSESVLSIQQQTTNIDSSSS